MLMSWLVTWPWRRILPVAGAALSVLWLLWAAYNWAYARGRDSERHRWVALQAEARDAAAQREAVLRDKVEAAATQLAERREAVDRVVTRTITKTRTYYAQNPVADVSCLDPERLRHIADSDAAALAAAGAAG